MKTVSELSGLPLQFAFLEALGLPMAGVPEGPFAVWCNDEVLLLFSEESGNVQRADLRTNYHHLVFEALQYAKGSISFDGNEIVCRTGASEGRGETYIDAAMRCLIAGIQLTTKQDTKSKKS